MPTTAIVSPYRYAAAGAAAGTYYVSPSGDDANAGTSPEEAWETIAKVNAGTYEPGNSILFEGGETFSGSLEFDEGSWPGADEANPVTIGSYGTGRATINAGAGSGFTAITLAGFVLKDLVFQGDAVSDADGVYIYNGNTGNGKLAYVRFLNLEVHGFGRSGIVVEGGSGGGGDGAAGFTDVLFEDCIARNCTNIYTGDKGTCGIHVLGWWSLNVSLATTPKPTHTNVVIRGCTAHTNTGNAGATGMWTGSGILVQNSQGVLIEHCVTHNNGENSNRAGGGQAVGLWIMDVDDALIQFNESYNNKRLGGGDGGGIDVDGGVTNAIVQFNYTHDNVGPGYQIIQFAFAGMITDNITLRYNISQNDGGGNSAVDAALYLIGSGPVTNLKIHNNTFYSNRSTAALIAVAGSQANSMTGWIANNILYSGNGGWLVFANVASPANLRFRGNAYHAAGTRRIRWGGTDYATLAAWRATGQEVQGGNVGLEANPMLANPGGGGTLGGYDPTNLAAYHLDPGSPMIGAALDILSLFGIDPGDQDFYGTTTPVGAGHDIGAHENDADV